MKKLEEIKEMWADGERVHPKTVGYLLSIIEQAEKDFEGICDLIDDESYGQAWIKSDEALQAIRGNVATEKRGGLLNPDGGDYPLKWMSQNND